jgi:hypothetical protein
VPPAPQLPADVRAPEQAHELDEYRHDDEAYDADNPPYGSHEDYQTEVPSVRRKAPELRLEPAAPTVPKDDRHGFAEFYQVYPRHVARGAAERAYRRIVKNGEATEADLLAGAMRYAAAHDGKDPTYTKHPATWLNGKCWLDEPAPASARPRSYLDSISALASQSILMRRARDERDHTGHQQPGKTNRHAPQRDCKRGTAPFERMRLPTSLGSSPGV